MVLFSGADSLELMDSKTHGYKDIRSTWSSSSETETTVYHWDGSDYVISKADNFKIVSPPNP